MQTKLEKLKEDFSKYNLEISRLAIPVQDFHKVIQIILPARWELELVLKKMKAC